MKKLLFLIVVLMIGSSVSAQSSHTNNKARKAVGIGLLGGGNLTHYAYINSGYNLNSLPFADSLLLRVHPTLGFTVDIPMENHLYITPEFLVETKGDARQYISTPSGSEVLYTATVSYLDVRVPIAYSIPVSKSFQPFVFVAPSVSLTLPDLPLMDNGITMTDLGQSGNTTQLNTLTASIDSATMAPFDAGLSVGVGCRYYFDFDSFSLALKFEVSYNMGLVNTYSKSERDEIANALNTNVYNIKGMRLNQGIECLFSVVLPLKFLDGGACSGWSNNVYHSSSKGIHIGF